MMKKPHTSQPSMKDVFATKATNRNSNLQLLASEFDVVNIKLTQFIEALKGQNEAQMEMSKKRIVVTEKAAALAEDSPLVSTRGRNDVTKSKQGNSLKVRQNLNSRRQMQTVQFLENTIKYTEEWYSIASRKVDLSLRKAHKLQKELGHYESKVNRLNFDQGRVGKRSSSPGVHRSRSSKSTGGGESRKIGGKIGVKIGGGNNGGVGAKTLKCIKTGTRTSRSGTAVKSEAYRLVQDRLQRNEHKMKMARVDYEKCIAETKAIIDELTQRCRQDLFPVLMKLAKFDVSLTADEKDVSTNLNALSRCLTDLKEREEQYSYSDSDTETRLQDSKSFESKLRLQQVESRSSSIVQQKDEDGDENDTAMTCDKENILNTFSSSFFNGIGIDIKSLGYN